MKISIIIPTYNRKKYLQNLLNQLKNEDCEIVVVDDKSTDGTKEMIKNNFPSIKYVLGSGKGQKFAKQKGIENSTGDIIGFLDDDARVKKGFLKFIKQDFEKGENIVQTKLIFLDKGQKNIKSEKNNIGKLKWNLRQNGNWNWGTNIRYIDLCAECGIFFRKNILNRIPFFDKNLIGDGYGESISFSLRAKEKGYKILFDPRSIVYHIGAQDGGSIEKFKKNRKYESECTDFTRIIVTNLIYLNKRFNKNKLFLVKIYFLIAGIYMSLIQQKNCLKYFIEGMKCGQNKKN